VRHPGDRLAQARFAEAHLTTGRFTEAGQRLAGLLAATDLDSQSKLVLQTLEIVTRCALGQRAQLPAQLQHLREALAGLPQGAQLRWSFGGVQAFVAKDARLLRSRVGLLGLLAALQTPDTARLGALDSLIKRRLFALGQ
jgi:hypothetical protein